MKMHDAKKQEKARRMLEIFRVARQRYLIAGGDPQKSVGSLQENDYLTDAERQEVLQLGEDIFDLDLLLSIESQDKQTTAG